MDSKLYLLSKTSRQRTQLGQEAPDDEKLDAVERVPQKREQVFGVQAQKTPSRESGGVSATRESHRDGLLSQSNHNRQRPTIHEPTSSNS